MPLKTLRSTSGDPLPSSTFEMALHFTGSVIAYVGSCAKHSPEHSDPRFKISIPLTGASIQVSWQTASGQQKQQHIKSGCGYGTGDEAGCGTGDAGKSQGNRQTTAGRAGRRDD